MDRAVPYLLVGLLAVALVVVIGAVAIQGVSNLASDAPADEPAPGWEPPPGPDPAFVYANPARSAAPPPPSLSRPLPRTAREVWARSGPPAGLVRARLAIGDAATQEELLSALRAAHATRASDDEVGAVFDPLLGAIDTPEHCAWLRTVLADDADVPLRRSFWDALLWCDDPATAAFFRRDDVPAETRITWWEEHHVDAGPVPVEPLIDAIAEVTRKGHVGSALRGASLLANAAPERLDDLRERLRGLPGRDARAALDALPSAPAEPSAPSLDEVVQSPTVDLDLLVATTDAPDRVARALVRCAVPTPEGEAADETRAADCLRALAVSSPPMAIQAARAVRRWGIETPYLRETVHALLDVGTGPVVRSRLADDGLIAAAEGPDPDAAHAVAARDVLRAHDRALCFPTDEGRQPLDYREVLQQLAYLGRPALGDVVFDQVPPGPSSYDYQLDAYVAGERFTVYAYDQGSVYDVPTMLGLLDSLARARSSDVRFALLASPDPATTCVVAGPEQSLLDAEEQGLITLAEP